MNTTININEFGSVIVGLLLVGAIFKNAFPSFPNRFIPLLTWLMGVAAYLALTAGWSNAQQWLAAIIAAASATGIHSGIKNTFEGGRPDGLPLILAGALLLGAGGVTGCVTNSPKPTPMALAFFTLSDTKTLVDGAEKVYGRACALGQVSAADQARVDEAIVKFHAAFKLAVRAARANYSSITPDEVQGLADQLVAVIQQLTAGP